MDLILVADCPDSTQPLLRVASKAGYRIVKLIGPNDEAGRYVESLRPDAIIFISDEVDRTLLRQMQAVTDRQPTPMLLFTRDSQTQSIDAAIKAGATGYVIDCNDAQRLTPFETHCFSRRVAKVQWMTIWMKCSMWSNF